MGAFATGELSDAQKTEKSEQLKASSNKTQSNDEILQALIYSWIHKETITILFKDGKGERKLTGQVVDVINQESFRFNDGKEQHKVYFSDVKGVFGYKL